MTRMRIRGPNDSPLTYYVIDRLKGRIAVLVGDDGRNFNVPRRDLPEGCREGSVLRLEVAAGAPPDWSRAVLDEAERTRRLDRARETLRRLGRSDPGGDVQL